MQIELNVSGMTCGHCKAAVESALKSVAGVSAVAVDLANGTAKVSGEGVQLEMLVAAVADEGYSASAAQ
jgi:copper chaperone